MRGERKIDHVLRGHVAAGSSATDAMWKAIPILGTQACGLRQQIRDGLDGPVISNPEDAEELARVLNQMLAEPIGLNRWAHHAQRRVHDDSSPSQNYAGG